MISACARERSEQIATPYAIQLSFSTSLRGVDEHSKNLDRWQSKTTSLTTKPSLWVTKERRRSWKFRISTRKCLYQWIQCIYCKACARNSSTWRSSIRKEKKTIGKSSSTIKSTVLWRLSSCQIASTENSVTSTSVCTRHKSSKPPSSLASTTCAKYSMSTMLSTKQKSFPRSPSSFASSCCRTLGSKSRQRKATWENWAAKSTRTTKTYSAPTIAQSIFTFSLLTCMIGVCVNH